MLANQKYPPARRSTKKRICTSSCSKIIHHFHWRSSYSFNALRLTTKHVISLSIQTSMYKSQYIRHKIHQPLKQFTYHTDILPAHKHVRGNESVILLNRSVQGAPFLFPLTSWTRLASAHIRADLWESARSSSRYTPDSRFLLSRRQKNFHQPWKRLSTTPFVRKSCESITRRRNF